MQMFDMIISKRFEKHRGYTKIQRKEFAIEEAFTGREVSRSSDWTMAFCPGQKIDMSVIFSERDTVSNSCPRCRVSSPELTEAKVQWYVSLSC